MSSKSEQIYEFGSYRLDAGERQLLRNGAEAVALTPKAFDLLLALVKQSGHLLGKEELLAAVWQDAFVEEATLSYQISALRKALGENGEGQRYIETVPKRGYRFVAAVTEVSNDGVTGISAAAVEALSSEQAPASSLISDSLTRNRVLILAGLVGVSLIAGLVSALFFRQRSAPAHHPEIKSLAVLPFTSLTAGSENPSLELGMADTLITRLSNIRQITVRPTSAVRKYTQHRPDPAAAGRELRVEAVLEGSIQHAGDRLRVTVRLVSVEDSQQLWAEKFDERFTDIFAVQDAIAERITGALALELTGEERKRLAKRYTENVEAFNLYLKGRFYERQFTGDRVQTGIGYFREAIEKDPGYALAYAGLADSYVALGTYYALPPQEAFAEARRAATRAVALDETLAEAHVSLAMVRFGYDWDWPDYEKHIRRARELNPNYAKTYYMHSQYLAATGRFEEALAEARRAQELESPLDLDTNLGWLLYFARRYDEAIAQHQKAIEIDRDLFRPHRLLGLAYLQKQRPEEAISSIRQSVELSGGSIEEKAYLGYAYAVAGQRAEALKILRELREQAQRKYVSPYLLALLAVGLGDKDQAFAWLDQAEAARSINLIYLPVEPIFDNLRSDPRFKDLLRRVKPPLFTG